MARVGVPVKQLDGVDGPLHEGIVHGAAREHGAHWDGPVGKAFGRRHEVGLHPEEVARKRRTQSTETCDDLVEDEQNAMSRADRTQALKVTLRWNEDARRASHRLDNYG